MQNAKLLPHCAHFSLTHCGSQFALTQCSVRHNFNSVICAVSLSQVVCVLCALHITNKTDNQPINRKPKTENQI